MKKILVPTDFSDQSLFGISSAATLNNIMDIEITILHVISDSEDPEEKDRLMQWIYNMEELKDVPHHFKQVIGKPIDVILDEPSDLIIMGSKGAKGFQSFFVGSNAEKVGKHAKSPVIILKQFANLSLIRNIVFPTNMKREDEEILSEIKALQDLFKANLHLVKAYDDSIVRPKEVEKRLREFAEFYAFEDYTVNARSGLDESDVIIRFADEINADLIAMATHDRKGLNKMFGGFISGEVINTNQRPLWVKALSFDF